MRSHCSSLLTLCTFLVSSLAFVPPAVPQNVQSVAATSERSICVVLAERAGGMTSGTGFIVADGFLLTAYHVVQDTEHLRARCLDHPSIDVALANKDASNDVALLHSTLLSIRPLPLGDSGKAQVGQEVVVIGFPRADLLGAATTTVTRGIVSSVGAGTLQIQAPVGPGNSGSPVLSLQGQVIGVVRAVLGSQLGVNFATSFVTAIDAAKPFLTSALGGPYGGVNVGNASPAPRVQQPTPGPGSFIITPGQAVGDLRLGMTLGEIEKLLGPAKGANPTNWFERYPYAVSRGLWVVASSGTVVMIGVRNDPRYVIPVQGLHHGSSETDVRTALGEPSRVETKGLDKLLYYDSLGLRFTISTDRGSGVYGLVYEIAIYKTT